MIQQANQLLGKNNFDKYKSFNMSEKSIKREEIQYHEYIVIGAGISGLQAGIILAEHDQDFIILQASDRLGGRVMTNTLGNVIKQLDVKHDWINQQVKNTTVEVGATWISKQHSYILHMIQQYELTLYSQYSDGLSIYGVNGKKYQKVQTLADFFKKYQKQLLNLVNKIQNLQVNMYDYSSQNGSQSSNKLLQEYIKFYDNMTVSDFIHSQIVDSELADMITNQIETLQCISTDNFSVLQLIDDDGCLQLIKLYCQKVDNTIDGLKIKQGSISLINKMAQNIFDIMDQNQSEYLETNKEIIRFNQPVQSIQNQLGEDVIITTRNGKKYSCLKVLFSVPIAVASNIKISRISESKKLIFDNQVYGSVTRFYFVFKQAFWRGKYNGYASFSRWFPFNQLTELSPASLSCGIVAFVFVHNKYENWIKQLKQMYEDDDKVQSQQLNYLLKVLADMFLQGDVNSPHLKGFFSYTRSFATNQFIRAAYQTTTKPDVWKKIRDSNDDYSDAYSRDQHNIVYIGSQFAEQDDYCTYLQGAVRLSRQKVYGLMGKKDPWLNIKNKIIQW